jgi:carotenoid cleavage dioxygenase
MTSLQATTYTNPFAIGAFRPVAEERTARDLAVEGALPPELDGLLLRNSFCPYPGQPLPPHLFFADGMVSGLRLRAGRAEWFRNRWVETEPVARARNAPAPAGPQDICWGPVNPANTHVVHHAGRLLALCEVGLPYELTCDLGTLGRYDFDGALLTNMTAHPRIDPDTGDLHFFSYGPRPPYVRYHHADANGRLLRSDVIAVRGPTVMHDFIITEHYAVFFDTPLVFAPPDAAAGGLPFRWNPDYGSRVGLHPLASGGETRWFDIGPCFVAHFLNAYEVGDEVVIRGVARDTGYALGGVSPDKGALQLQEWRIELGRGHVSETVVSDRRGDLPRVDERRLGRPHRFGYSAEAPATPDWASRGGLFKYDLQTGAALRRDFGPGRKASEPIFVPGGAGEDEGWVLSIVHDEAEDRSFLAVLEAQAFDRPPVARVPLPQRVPYGAHGSWIEGALLG